MTLNLVQLATLREFVRRGSLTAAADALGYTPGAASQHITALERTVGAPLLRKAGRNLALTDAGRVLAEHADVLLVAEARAVQALADSLNMVSGSLVVGTWGSTTAALLAPVLSEAASKHPLLSIRSREIDVDEAAKEVRLGDVDVAFGLDYDDAPMARDSRIKVVRLRREEFELAVGPAHPLASHEAVSLRELGDAEWILPTGRSSYGVALRAACRKHGFEPRVAHEVTDTAATVALAADGLGIAPVTELMLRLNPSVPIRRIRLEESIARHIVLLLPNGVHPRSTLAALVQVIREVVADSQ
ncbi:MAG TPA: LysR substrate-binding domain-containing protein [Nocardioidaceae bacterium]|nr:LysR substrate-binding domain-containing protein [Nocardioidaceae bacterium]